MLKNFLLSLLATSCVASSVYAQGSCATDEVYRTLKAEHPEIATYEAQLDQALKNLDLSRFAKITGTPDTAYYDIPIVVHVIHDYGAEDISDASIYEAVQYWSTIYQKQNSDTIDVIQPFKKYVGNPRMRLHLATKDPNGNPTKGITRHQSYLAFGGNDQSKLDGWPNNQYINVWFVHNFSGADAFAAAYAYYPSAGASMPYYDGVIGLYSYVNYDKAIPHEIGHVLNLEHPWGNTNQPGVACGDDDVDDTPPTMGHNPVSSSTYCSPLNFDPASPLWDATCAANYKKTYHNHLGLDSVVDYPDTTNAQNIMDYTYCQRMFTNLQVQRMRSALTSTVAGRNNLYSAANLAATGALAPMPDLPPVADFSVEKGQVSSFPLVNEPRTFFLCQNDRVNFQFKNQSWNDTITSAQWRFTNEPSIGTSTSTTTVLTKFAKPGWVSATLIVTGNNTGTDSITKQAVYVADTVSQLPGVPQNFYDATETAQWPTFNYYNNQFKWELYSGAGYGDNNCIRYHSYDDRTSPANKTGTEAGDYDDMVTPAFDLTGMPTPTNLNLNFYTSGTYLPTPAGGQSSAHPIQDTMKIYASSDCGGSWNLISTIDDANLLNVAKQSTEFVPSSSSQWRPQTVSIPVAYRTARTFFRIRYMPANNSNNLYLDDFVITPFSTEVNEVASNANMVKVYPNPSHGDSKLLFTTGNDGNVSYSIKDITGKTLFQKQTVYATNTVIQEQLNANLFPAAGLYFITVTIEKQTITQKLIIE